MSLLWVEGERREGPPFDADPASLWGHFAVHLEEGSGVSQPWLMDRMRNGWSCP